VGIDSEHHLEPVLLLFGEEICAGAQGPPRPVERIVNYEEPVIFSMLQCWLHTVNPVRPDIPAKLWRYLRHTFRCIKPS